MRRLINRYCSDCLRTRKFLNLRDRSICQYCSKTLWRRDPGRREPGRREDRRRRETPVSRERRRPEPVPLRRQRTLFETA